MCLVIMYCLFYAVILVLIHLTGYYTQISTLADVQENVMEYLHVLSRPMVINHDHDIIWTEAYMDSAVSDHPDLRNSAGVTPCDQLVNHGTRSKPTKQR